ncbi:MAG TPA: tRNA dihydrouridine synthase DusB [Chthoniobacterales bacterium]|nr:tRNA dihydrouridine synthase DusB [Chthoniobacterales bacterium]
MATIPPWFRNRFPLYLAPMAGVTDKIFRQICKSYGADVLVTEFVSAEGISRRNERTREYLDFDDGERPLGVQLFGASPTHMAEAAKQVVDWVAPDFIDLNFGCPVNKVVARNGGSALLKDCLTLSNVATAVVQAVAPLPVTAKIRIGWDANSINAVRIAEILQQCGISALAVHGRTRAQGYSGEADWHVIAEVAEAVTIPVIGNGDLFSAREVARRRTEMKIGGVMIGRAAMSAPWIFRQIKHYLETSELLLPPELSERWNVIIEHCRRHADDWGDEKQAVRSMRARLMAYSRNFSEAKALREKFQHVSKVSEIEDIAYRHLTGSGNGGPCRTFQAVVDTAFEHAAH